MGFFLHIRGCQINLAIFFVNEVLLEYGHIVAVITFKLKQNYIVVTETVWYTEPKIFIIWLFTEKVMNLLYIMGSY